MRAPFFINKRIISLIFAIVKRRIYAISLLLSFLVVLSHELIEHHHHHDLAFVFSSKCVHDFDNDHLQDKLNHQHESKNIEKDSEHNHSFPCHHHFCTINDFAIERTNLLEGNSQIPDAASFLIAYLLIHEFAKPLNLKRNLYGEQQFLKSTLFIPATNALRGPPAIV